MVKGFRKGTRTKRDALTANRLREVLDYDPQTGLFTWKVPRPKCSKGSPAGHIDADGYRTIRIDWVLHEAARLAWLYVHGRWPEPCVDHINRDKSDNRIANLREADKRQNGVNRGAQKNSLSGVKGVSKHGSGWRAKIHMRDKVHLLGTFATVEEAGAAYERAAVRLFGEFGG